MHVGKRHLHENVVTQVVAGELLAAVILAHGVEVVVENIERGNFYGF